MKERLSQSSFLGLEMAQSPYAIAYWEKLLFTRPLDRSTIEGRSMVNRDVKRIIEIGTAQGNLSFYLFLLSKVHGIDFCSYDITPKDRTIDAYKEELGFYDSLIVKDCFDGPEIENKIKQDGTTLLFCDGGDKVKEFNYFARFLKPGDLIGAHDWEQDKYTWPVEITYASVQDAIDKYNLREIKIENQEQAVTRFFTRRK